jgi:hypothetical protein
MSAGDTRFCRACRAVEFAGAEPGKHIVQRLRAFFDLFPGCRACRAISVKFLYTRRIKDPVFVILFHCVKLK